MTARLTLNAVLLVMVVVAILVGWFRRGSCSTGRLTTHVILVCEPSLGHQQSRMLAVPVMGRPPEGMSTASELRTSSTSVVSPRALMLKTHG